MEFGGRVTAYLQFLLPDLVGCHVIFNADKMEGHAHELRAFEGRKRGTVAHVHWTQSFHHPALCWNKVSLFVFVYLPVCFLYWQRMNSCSGASAPPPRELQMPLPLAPTGLATLKHIYSGRPVRADPEC